MSLKPPHDARNGHAPQGAGGGLRVLQAEGARPYAAIVDTPFAVVGLAIRDGKVSGVEFLPLGTPAQAPRDALAREFCRQLQCYLRDAHFRFDLPLEMAGTAFQQRVWAAIADIAPGATRTYAALAAQVGSGARAVANACGANPIALVIPCHRVLASDELGGFMGGRAAEALAIKQGLLRHEGAW